MLKYVKKQKNQHQKKQIKYNKIQLLPEKSMYSPHGTKRILNHYSPTMPFGNRKKYFRGSLQFSIFTI